MTPLTTTYRYPKEITTTTKIITIIAVERKKEYYICMYTHTMQMY